MVSCFPQKSSRNMAAGPFVSFETITKFRGFISCLVLAISYVASLYVWRSPHPRDHPKTISQRFKSVLAISVLAPLYIWLWADDKTSHNVPSLWHWLGIHLDNILLAITLPLFLTVVLFLGPLVLMYVNKRLFEDTQSFLHCPTAWLDFMKMRNYLVAPLTEEFVFRACMIPLLVQGFGNNLSIFICPLFFGVAHIHHVIERLRVSGENTRDVWLNAVFQFGYTTVFGGYSAFLFIRTGHLIGPVICHSFCNFMGFPALEQVATSKNPRVLSAMFVLGLFVFLCLVFPLTEPTWYNSIYYK